MADARCEYSDLPADQCGCEHCQPDVIDPLDLPTRYVGSERESHFSTRCRVCERRIDPGHQIALADLAGDGGSDDAWCHDTCTKEP